MSGDQLRELQQKLEMMNKRGKSPNQQSEKQQDAVSEAAATVSTLTRVNLKKHDEIEKEKAI